MKYLNILSLLVLLVACEESKEKNTYQAKEPVYQHRSTKRGVAFSFQFIEDFKALSSGIAWSYNWGLSQSTSYDNTTKDYEIDYIPMAWNGINETRLRELIARRPKCKYLLGFNEPNLSDQANMTPREAANRWPAIKAIAEELKLKLISPAMNYGTLEDYSDPIKWLDEFFEFVPLNEFEGIAIHCYMPSAESLKNFIEQFKKYNKPIWLTEFCAWDGSITPKSQQQYMSDAVNYLESCASVERYAWFIPRRNEGPDAFPYMPLLKNTFPVELTELGMIYNQMSTMDTTIYYVEQQHIEAEHYSTISIAESANTTGWTTGPKTRVTTDAPNESLELYNFFMNQWVEYQICADRNKDYNIEIRYATFIDAEFELYIDRELATTFTLTSTGRDFIWNTSTITTALSKGNHTIRFRLIDGACTINWWRFV